MATDVTTHETTAAQARTFQPMEGGAQLKGRIDELDALATFLHADLERHKSAIARELHDDLAGSVIAAMMDVAWVEEHEPPGSPGTKMRFGRIKESLREAINLARRMVEELRPTLLDTIGLFAALSWQFKRGCERAKISYTEAYPDTVPEMDMGILIALFRIAQEAFSLLLRHEGITAVSMLIEKRNNTLAMQLSGNGVPPLSGERGAVVSSMFHRTRNISGSLSISAPPSGGATFQVSIPLSPPAN
jgi:signal transduction histidine kinase